MQALFDCLALHHLGRVVANTVHYQLVSSPLQNSSATVCLSSSGRKCWTAVTGVSVSVPAVRVDFRGTGVSLTLCGCFQEKYSQRRADVLGWRQQGIAEHTEVRVACVCTHVYALSSSVWYSASWFRVETLLTRTLSHQSKTRLIFFQTFICFMMLSCISRTRAHTHTHTLSACIFLCLMSLLWYTDSSFLQGGKTHRIQRALTQPSVLRECWEVKTQIRVQVSVNAAAFNMIWRYEGKYTYMPLCVTTKNKATNCSSSNVHLRLVKKLISSQQ